MSEIARAQEINERLLEEANAIMDRSDDVAAQKLYDAMLDLMIAADVDRSTMFAVMIGIISSWVSVIGCSGCRGIEIARMGTAAKLASDQVAEQTGGDDAESYHATRH